MKAKMARLGARCAAASVRVGFVVAAAGVVAGSAACARREQAGAAVSSTTAPTDAAPEAAAAASAAEPTNVPFPKELVDLVVNPEHLPPYSGPTGSVEGIVTVTGPAPPDVKLDTRQCAAAIDTYGKLFREGAPETPGGPRPLADAVVIAVGYGGHYLPEKNPAQLIAIGTNCGYPARTVAITFGQRIEITNASKYPFAPTIDTDTSPAVMMAAPFGAGDAIRLYPRKPGHSVMGDLMEPYVREDLYVLRHPLHAVSGLDGHYRIDGIPVGKMSIRAQHPTVASEATAPVTIEAGVVQKVDVTLEYAPKAPNKGDIDRTNPQLR